MKVNNNVKVDNTHIEFMVIPPAHPPQEYVHASIAASVAITLLDIRLITPPVGINVFVIKTVVGDTIWLERVFKGLTWFVVTDIVTLAILIAYPQISLLIPQLMG